MDNAVYYSTTLICSVSENCVRKVPILWDSHLQVSYNQDSNHQKAFDIFRTFHLSYSMSSDRPTWPCPTWQSPLPKAALSISRPLMTSHHENQRNSFCSYCGGLLLASNDGKVGTCRVCKKISGRVSVLFSFVFILCHEKKATQEAVSDNFDL